MDNWKDYVNVDNIDLATIIKDIAAINMLKEFIELIDDELGYGITIKGLYTYKNISKEKYEFLKEVLSK